ncbi:resolvase, partial [Fervidicella metallireducens AeB]
MQRKVIKLDSKIIKPISKKRVAAYARVSSGKDAMLHSLSAQISYYSSFIQKHIEWEFAGVYADEAITGTKDERPEFQRMLDDCRMGKIDMIITKSISRFARNTVTLLETVRELKDLNVDVYFEKENIHSLSGDGELMLTILASFAQEESRSVSENIKWRIRKGFKEGELVNLRFMYG